MEGPPIYPEFNLDTPEKKSDDDDDESPEVRPGKDDKSKHNEREEGQQRKEHQEKDDTEKKKPLGEITEEEKPAVLEAIAKAQQPAVAGERQATADESVEAVAIDADLRLLENLEELKDLEQAFDKTLEQLDLERPGEPAEEEPVIENEGVLPLEEDAEEITLPIATGGAAGSGSGGGGNNTPPPPPNPHPSSPLGGPIGPSGGGLGGPGIGPNFGPTPPNFNVAPPSSPASQPERIDYHPNAAGYFFLGGIVGYLLGRRRGRIKTEKKLIPIQKKLENQVRSLHDEVIRREATIRDMVRSQIAEKPEKQPLIKERLTSAKAPEAVRQSKEHEPTRLGKMIVERIRTPESLPAREVHTLSQPELLAVAERIEIGQTTVRKLYETGKLDLEGLKQIVAEFLEGGDFERILRHQLRPERLSDDNVRETREAKDREAEHAGVQPWPTAGGEPVVPGAFANMHRANSSDLKKEPYQRQTDTFARVAVKSASVTAVVMLIILVVMLIVQKL